MTRYLYGMRLRGFSPATFPQKGFIECLQEKEFKQLKTLNRYHDILAYERKLTELEIQGYELDFIGIQNVGD